MRIFLILTALATLLVGCNSSEERNADVQPGVPANGISRPDAALSDLETKIFKANVSEELVLRLAPQLKALEKKLKGESADLTSLFAESVNYLGPSEFDFTKAFEQQRQASSHSVAQHIAWPISDREVETEEIQEAIWAPLLEKFAFEDTQFGVLEGLLQTDDDIFEMKVKFEGRITTKDGHPVGIKAKQKIKWKPINESEWRVFDWHQISMEVVTTSQPLFENVTNQAIPDDETRELLTQSLHEARILQRAKDRRLLGGANPVFQYFADWVSLFQYTSVSVVDLDQDDWDDLYILDRTGQSILLRNNGDGSFEDVSESCGLKLNPAMANCSLFADFDNDGDSDVLVGRTLEPSLYFRNDGGTFVPDEETNQELFKVRFVSAGSVADVNGDGLLDVYLSTYSTRSGEDVGWVQYAVPPSQQQTLLSMISSSHPFLDRRGPPNVLLLNKGGKLKRVEMSFTLEQWRNSFQSVWTDFDDDGDPDLYICNDFAPDVFLRNDTKRGSSEIRLNDATLDAFVGNTMGFGMGASVGDYDADGKLDLYISNMYSKAGHRVIQHFDGDVDPRITVSARGNFLYRNTGGQFEHVAGLEDGKQQVSMVGWSFGGQFADFNNDGRLDLYVPSGFFSAPRSISEPVDL